MRITVLGAITISAIVVITILSIETLTDVPIQGPQQGELPAG
jgi:hypothetical protein